MSNASVFLGKRLRALRHSAGLTQEQAAAAVEVSFKYYQRMESGTIEGVRLSTIENIAHAYGLELGQFFEEVLPAPTLMRDFSPPPHRKAPKK